MDYQFLEVLCEQILGKGASIRWAGVVNDNGIILNSKRRPGLLPLLTQEENEEYVISAISRHKTRTKFETKIGKLRYAFGKYEGLNRATIPITTHHYLLLTFDKDEKNFDSIIMEKILPLVENNISQFVESPMEKCPASEYESGTFRCTTCAEEFLTKEDADKHNHETHKQESVYANE
ncbi:hypothetical protein [Nitrososphaera viennensis]|uniref:C2H2-type domain-containing protein n=1 Tax=Nitrososphaera viennensis TaxID=1034015 RepID=A0A977IF92_9ARCH|nr:hypothetical protein [Nitrososphaera viennensis]UVS69898.1 hypothetical protein NWT39_03705 [Nitrososphaera viennensis]